jgi:hypothetical protein
MSIELYHSKLSSRTFGNQSSRIMPKLTLQAILSKQNRLMGIFW